MKLTEADLTQLQRKRVRGGVAAPTPPQEKESPAPQYRNKWELNYSKVLDLEQKAGIIRSWRYEGLTFRLAKGHYHRIDFLVGHNDRSIELVQVKGWHKNIRASLKGLHWAAQLYPQFIWRIVHWTGSGFDGEYVVTS